MIVVTSGNKYIDIDAYASCIAYANLLNLKGQKAKAVSSAKPNESIPSSLLNLNIGIREVSRILPSGITLHISIFSSLHE